MLSKSSHLVVAVVVLSASCANANENSSLDVGTTVFLKMTGELAQKYGQQTGLFPNDLNPALGLSIETSVQVIRKLEDGSVQLEHTTMISKRPKEPLLITLTATVKPDAITVMQTPAGTLVSSSPADSNPVATTNKPDAITVKQTPAGTLVSSSPADLFPVATTKPTRSYQIQLRDLKGVKLRTWKLQSEFGQ